MTFLSRYLAGEAVAVYTDIEALGPAAFKKEHYEDVLAVLNETFRRVAYNLDIIYRELVTINYNLKKTPQYSFEKPLVKPLPDTNKLLEKLDKRVKRFGYVPLSLKAFYQVVGGCNFTWDYETLPAIPWEGADPIAIYPLDDLLSELIEEDHDEDDFEGLQLAPDDLTKDNISGGPAYAIELTPKPNVDSRFLNERHDTTFIKYLRIVFEYAGFPGAADMKDVKDLQAFLQKVRLQMLPI